MTIRLRHLVNELKTGPFGSALSADEYVDEGVPLINPSDLRGGAIWPDRAAKVPEAVAARMAAYRVKAGDIVLARRGELGRYGIVGKKDEGFLCGTGSLLVRPARNLDAKFFGYFLETADARDWLSLQSVGSTMENLSESILARLPVPNLPTDAQWSVARFLDEQTARIDALIAEKERLGAAVREYEQAQISQLLARGINGGKLTVTGNQYVPEAPIQWRVVPFKRALRGMEQGWSPQCENQPAGEGEWGVLKVGCVNGTMFNASENKALPPELAPDMSCIIHRGDLLVSRANTRELVGSAALVEGEYPNLLLCDKLYRLKLDAAWVTSEFAVLLLRSNSARRQIELGASGASSSMQNISQDVLRELVVALPPPGEQHEIVQRARTIRTSTDDLARHIKIHVERLREYRSSLISAAVTGQLDINSYKEAA